MSKVKGFKVLIPCRSDKKNKTFEAGDILAQADALSIFGREVIAEWLEIGVLEETEWQPEKEK